MIPILYEKDEAAFASNGLGRLHDIIEATVSEERNGLYELDFSIPMTSEDFDQIQVGRIVGVTHDESEDVQPFDIVSYSRPINGVVTFHCVHISYRQSYMTVTGSSINSLADAFTLLGTAQPNNPFNYQTDKDSTGYMAAADGTPRSVRQMLGGVEGSILDAYGGEYEWDRWTVKLWSVRGTARDFAIRYGVNMTDYNEDFDSQGTYSSCIPYWTDGENTVVGDRQDSYASTITGRGECVPLDVSDKFEEQPTKAQVEAMGMSLLTGHNTALPTQNIHVEFVRLQDLGYENLGNLMQCKLCDTINVIFPDYNATGRFKIVKTVWNVLKDRYDSMELGDLSTSLSEALGISNGLNNSSGGGGGGSGTPIPTPDTTAAFDSSAHMNSTDMSQQEVDDFVDNIGGGGGSTETFTPTISTTTGTLVSASGLKRSGIATLNISVKNASAIANSGNVFVGTMSNYRPLANSMGASYYDGIHFDIYITTSGAITVRNTGTATLASNAQINGTITYII